MATRCADARRKDQLADLIAGGATFTAAAYAMRRPISEIERLWREIVRGLGRQAR